MLASAGKSLGTSLLPGHGRRECGKNRGRDQCRDIPAKPGCSARVRSNWESVSGAARRDVSLQGKQKGLGLCSAEADWIVD